MVLENKLGITSQIELASADEKSSSKRPSRLVNIDKDNFAPLMYLQRIQDQGVVRRGNTTTQNGCKYYG